MKFSNRSALVISDNFILSLTLTGILKKDDQLTVFEAQSVRSAASVINNERPDLIFIDTDTKSLDLSKLDQILSGLTLSTICFITHKENVTELRNQSDSSGYRMNVISKPLVQEEIMNLLSDSEFVYA